MLVYFDSDRADRTFAIRTGASSVVGRDAGTFAGSYVRARDGNVATATTRVVVGPPVPNLVLFLVDDMGWQDTSVSFHRDAAGKPVISALHQR